jgi:hypothetical protein
MEVHHHPAIHKKNFKEFFLEFVMIFLAVTLGFIAENVRETISNHEQGKHYVESLINDLNEDTATMNIVLKENHAKVDSLLKLAQLANADFSKAENLIKLYKKSGMIGDYSLFKSNDATLNQLKTSGLQLIKKDHVADSIAAYDVKLKLIYSAEEIYLKGTNDALDASQQFLNFSALESTAYFDITHGFKNKLLPLYEDNAWSLPRFFNKIDFEIGATKLYIMNIERVLPFAERLISYLKNEYDLNK